MLALYRTTDDLFQRCLHRYTISHAIEDRTVLRFHIDYYKPEGKNKPNSNKTRLTARRGSLPSVAVSNVLSEEKRQQVIARGC